MSDTTLYDPLESLSPVEYKCGKIVQFREEVAAVVAPALKKCRCSECIEAGRMLHVGYRRRRARTTLKIVSSQHSAISNSHAR